MQTGKILLIMQKYASENSVTELSIGLHWMSHCFIALKVMEVDHLHPWDALSQ